MVPIKEVIQLKHKIKILQQKIRRDRKIDNIKDLLKTLQEKGLIEKEEKNKIFYEFEGVSAELFKNELKNMGRVASGNRYSNVVKQFALTLHYNSPKAYNFCRTVLKLPHPNAITKWTSSVEAEPGFFKEVFSAFKTFPEDNRDFNLIVDAMVIRKQVLWSTKIKNL